MMNNFGSFSLRRKAFFILKSTPNCAIINSERWGNMKKKILIGSFLLLVLVTAIVFLAWAIQSYNYDMDPANGVDIFAGFGHKETVCNEIVFCTCIQQLCCCNMCCRCCCWIFKAACIGHKTCVETVCNCAVKFNTHMFNNAYHKLCRCRSFAVAAYNLCITAVGWMMVDAQIHNFAVRKCVFAKEFCVCYINCKDGRTRSQRDLQYPRKP